MKTRLIILWLCGTSALSAATLNFASLGTAGDPNQYNMKGDNVVISGHPGWASPLPGSAWVSYAETGNPDAPGYFMPANGLVVSFFQAISLPWVPTSATLTYRADDTAGLYINNMLVQLEASSVGNTYSRCSDFAPGCIVSTQITINILPYLSQGTNMIRFDVSQRNSLSFGLNYSGSVTGSNTTPTNDTPEPGSWALLGAGLAAAGLRKRKKLL